MSGRLLELLNRPVEQAAAGLLGWRLRTDLGDGRTEIVLCEIEAYGGADDPASHAYGGQTRRNSSMFAGAGTLYVYRSYGMHWCANVVTGESGAAGALLLRGGVAKAGRIIMESRRGRQDHLTDGPGRLCQAVGIDGEHDGTSLLDGSIRLLPPAGQLGGKIVATPRIGISRATDRLWRFHLAWPWS